MSAILEKTPEHFESMHPSMLAFPPTSTLYAAESIQVSGAADTLFFDLDVEYVPDGAQILVGLYLDPSMKGFLDELRGLSIQIDASTGVISDSLQNGRWIGILDKPLCGRQGKITLAFRVRRFGSHFISTMGVIEPNTGLPTPLTCRCSAHYHPEAVVLPAFYASGEIPLTAVVGYYTDRWRVPVLGKHQLCVWPDDVGLVS